MRSGLTERQFDILRGLLNGLSNKEIAISRGIAVNTVRDHNKAIFKYLGITKREQLKLLAVMAYFVPKAKGAGE